MPTTIRDVAKAAGVSPATVSRALGMSELVTPATRERVRAVAARLGYAPNRAARGLITGRTGNVGLVVPDLLNPIFPSVIKAIQARGRETDYAVFIADTDENAAAERDLVRALAQQVDGVILCAPRADEAQLSQLAAGTELVTVFRRVEGIPAVTVDDADGTRQIVEHLAALGHRRLVWVGGPAASWSNRRRAAGLRAATERLGLELAEVGWFPPYYDGGVAAADLVLASGATAAVAYNDTMALGLLARLHARGVRIPGELSVVGIDGIPMAGMAHPALTTVQVPAQAVGRAAVDLMLDRLRGPEQPAAHRRELPVHLVVRDSTGSAPGSTPEKK
ncbi:LacI family DNA-binding transcriptional regulator [Streptomyces hirsutus]|uniref:LacI family DNA-binding transcriptional regulator n=1 Tax=Streptomyces hirsutus TaxID=35620 RepID=UPI0006E2EF6B|nr:LacI family DNA-binding transcriptional regulator [Streptomyces hirsutus]